ncbi:MAG: phosphocholine cytidylyltransferase family protein [Clostridia bacterium]|nr:phosphocholine cytidylyltransferase family protein [Clostridia bacterium]
MKALILAAGFGKRLRPLTDTMPKSMVPVNGTPLLVNALNCLTACGIEEIGIVVGHMADYIRSAIGDAWQGVPVRYFENKEYLTTNNIYSLYQAADFCDSDMLLLECDLIYKKTMLEKLLAGQGECSILVSPFDPATMDGSVIEVVEGDTARALILGKWQEDGFDYTHMRKTVNLYRFEKGFVQKKFIPLVRWYVANMGVNSYYEKVLGSLLYYRECDARIVEVPASMWCEIDDAEDLKRAERHFAQPAE